MPGPSSRRIEMPTTDEDLEEEFYEGEEDLVEEEEEKPQKTTSKKSSKKTTKKSSDEKVPITNENLLDILEGNLRRSLEVIEYLRGTS